MKSLNRIILSCIFICFMTLVLIQTSSAMTVIGTLNDSKQSPYDVVVFEDQSIVHIPERGFFRFDVSNPELPVLMDSLNLSSVFDDYGREGRFVVEQLNHSSILSFDPESGLEYPEFDLPDLEYEHIMMNDTLIHTLHYTSEEVPGFPYIVYTLHANFYSTSNPDVLTHLFYYEEFRGDYLINFEWIMPWNGTIMAYASNEEYYSWGAISPEYGCYGDKVITRDEYLISFIEGEYDPGNIVIWGTNYDDEAEEMYEFILADPLVNMSVTDDSLIIITSDGHGSLLQMYDISDVNNVIEVKTISFEDRIIRDFDVYGSLLHVIENNRYVIYDISGENAVYLSSWGEPNLNPEEVEIIGDYVYGLVPTEGLRVYDIGLENEMVEQISGYPLSFHAEKMKKIDTNLILWNNTALQLFTTDTGEIVLSDSLLLQGNDEFLDVYELNDGSIVIQTITESNQNPVEFYTIGQNGGLEYQSSLNLGDETLVGIFDNNLALLSTESGLSFLDVADLEDTTRVSVWDPNYYFDYTVDFGQYHNFAYVRVFAGRTSDRLRIFDLSDPNNAQEVNTIRNRYSHIKIESDLLVQYGELYSNFVFYNLEDPEEPVVEDHYNETFHGYSDIEFHAGARKIIAVDENVTFVLNYEGNISSVDDQQDRELPKSFSVGQAYPNPFNSSVRFSMELPQKAEVNMVIYDLLGRVVYRVQPETYTAGNHFLTWDGTNQNSAISASGIYFVRINTGELSITRKTILLK